MRIVGFVAPFASRGGGRGQYSGKNRFIEKPGVQDEGVAMWLNVVLTPG